jgi:dUTP pyrophosphatase
MKGGYGQEFDTQKVRRLIAEKGWTHEDMAWECGMAKKQITWLLKIGRCRPNTLSILADALGVEIKELLYERKDDPMKVMLDPGAKMPTRAHAFDAGLDLYAKNNDTFTVPPYGGSVTIDTGVHVQIPQHFAGLVKSKSGLMVNSKILTDGTVDCDYNGSIHVTLFNYGEFSYTVEPGSKIAQLVITPVCLPPLELVDEMEETCRGNNGFGSTGKF